VLNVMGTDASYFNEQWPTSAAWLLAVVGAASAWDVACAPPPTDATFYNDTAFYGTPWRAGVVGEDSAGTDVSNSVLYSAFSSLDAQGWEPGFDSAAGTWQPDLSAQGQVPGRGFVLGGATLTQQRFAPGPCPAALNGGAGNFSALGAGTGDFTGGAACATTGGGGSTAAFGGGGSFNVTAFDGTVLPVGRAFVAGGVPGSPKTPAAFRAWLSAFADVPTALCRDAGFLLDAGWVGPSTESLEVSLAVMSPELGRVAHVRMTARASAGGLWSHSWRAQSVLLAPYGDASRGAGRPLQPGLAVVLDVLICAYFAYLVASVCKRGARGCILAAGDAARARRGKRGAGPACCLFLGALPSRLPPLSVAVDWFSVAAYAAAIATWAAHCGDLAAFNRALAALPRLTPTLVDGSVDPAVWAPGPGSDTSAAPGAPPPWATVEALAGVAVDSYVAFQAAALLALVGLTLRTLKYMAFQAHLAVLFKTLRTSCSAMAHFSLPLVTAFVAFGVWGMFSFGHHLPLWSNTQAASLSIMRFMMYDYDVPGFAYADGTGLYALYYTAFMMGVTNIMLCLVRFARGGGWWGGDAHACARAAGVAAHPRLTPHPTPPPRPRACSSLRPFLTATPLKRAGCPSGPPLPPSAPPFLRPCLTSCPRARRGCCPLPARPAAPGATSTRWRAAAASAAAGAAAPPSAARW
jgi:hypothetical protein